MAAVDPRREHLAPAALGALLARLNGAPLGSLGGHASRQTTTRAAR
jgi:hypothetical protein